MKDNKVGSKPKFEPRCCPYCKDYMFCLKNAKAECFCDRRFDVFWMLAGQPLDDECKKCGAGGRECFEEKP